MNTISWLVAGQLTATNSWHQAWSSDYGFGNRVTCLQVTFWVVVPTASWQTTPESIFYDYLDDLDLCWLGSEHFVSWVYGSRIFFFPIHCTTACLITCSQIVTKWTLDFYPNLITLETNQSLSWVSFKQAFKLYGHARQYSSKYLPYHSNFE